MHWICGRPKVRKRDHGHNRFYTKHFFRAVIIAILARSSAVGSIFMAVSDKNIGPRFVNIIFVVATIDARSFTDKLQHLTTDE
jgi:hypothetical protein